MEMIADRYRLDRLVGKGSVGEVWEASDVLLERTVAVKLVDLENNSDPAIEERFRREGIAIAGMNHPNIVKVYDTGTDGNRAFLVMDLLSGPNLAVLVRETGPIDPIIGMKMLADVASGLQEAHNLAITHRDVKPANIVLNAKPAVDGTKADLFEHPELGRPILVDFGIARLMNETEAQLTGTATAIGTAAYMSPEQAMNIDIDDKSDIYSLGCVAYYLFTGQPPFVGDSSVAVAHSQVYDDPLPLTDYLHDAPPALEALLGRMLAKKPVDRPTAAQVAEELRAIAANPDLSPTYLAAPAESVEKNFLSKNANRLLLTLVIVALIGLVIYAWGRPSPTQESTPTVTLTQIKVSTQTAQQPRSDDNPPVRQAPVEVEPSYQPTQTPVQTSPETAPSTTFSQEVDSPSQTVTQQSSPSSSADTVIPDEPVTQP